MTKFIFEFWTIAQVGCSSPDHTPNHTGKHATTKVDGPWLFELWHQQEICKGPEKWHVRVCSNQYSYVWTYTTKDIIQCMHEIQYHIKVIAHSIQCQTYLWLHFCIASRLHLQHCIGTQPLSDNNFLLTLKVFIHIPAVLCNQISREEICSDSHKHHITIPPSNGASTRFRR